MPIAIEMPKLSDTMTEGTLVRWIKKVGDTVAVGDVLAEVETDKATMEMEAFDDGVLTEIYVKDGEKVQIGQKLALLVGQRREIRTDRSETFSSEGADTRTGRLNRKLRAGRSRHDNQSAHRRRSNRTFEGTGAR